VLLQLDIVRPGYNFGGIRKSQYVIYMAFNGHNVFVLCV